MARRTRVVPPLLLLALTGCGSTRSFFGGDLTAQVLTDPGINRDSPVQVELLVVYDDNLLEQISALSAKDWFDQREGILRNYTAEESYTERRWELVPGQPPFQEEISFSAGARKVLVFANYSTPGNHRYLTDPHEDLFIYLQDADVCVRSLSRRDEVPSCTASSSTASP